MIGNHCRMSILEIECILHGVIQETNRKIAIYGQVSSYDQKKKGDLDRKVEIMKVYCKKTGYAVEYMFTELGSGFNTKHSGLRKLCKLVEQGKIEKVILSYSDRLTWFGFDYLSRYFTSHGTSIHAINKK